MFGWLSKLSRDARAPASEQPATAAAVEDAPASSAARVMRELPARASAPPGAADAPAGARSQYVNGFHPDTDPRVEWLRHADPDTRVAAARELGRLGDVRAVAPLVDALRDIHAPVRVAAAHALGKLRDERSVDPLAEILTDHEATVQAAARSALEAIGSVHANAVLAEDDHRRAVAEARAVGASRLEPEDEQPQQEQHVAPPEEENGVAPLIGALRNDNDVAAHAAAAAGLREAGPAAVEPLLALLRDPSVFVRKRTADVLGAVADARAAEPLAAALDALSPHDRSFETWQLRDALRRALDAVRPPAPPPPAPPPPPPVAIEPLPAPVAMEPPPVAIEPLPAPVAMEPAPAAVVELAPVEVEAEPVAPPLELETPDRPPPTGFEHLTDEQLGTRLREIALAAMGGGTAPLDTYDGRRDAARVIGQELHQRGGVATMERFLDEYVGTLLTRHTIAQNWDGVGEWRW